MHPWIYDAETHTIRFVGPPRSPTAFDWLVWVAQWAAVAIVVLVALAVLAIILTWAYSQITIILSNRRMIKADAQGRLPVNRSMIQSGAFVQAAFGLVDPNMIRPDQRGLLPVAKANLEAGALNEALIALATEYIKAQRIPANVPAHIVYSPHTSNDRALDVSLAQGMGASGGGAFDLLTQAAQDQRFTVALPDSIEIPFDTSVEADHA